MNTQTVTINLVPGLSTPPVVNVKQGDIGRPLAFRVMDGTTLTTLPTGVTAKVEGTKPSGLGFSVTGTISGNTVTLDTTEEMTQEAGKIPTEISFTKTGLVLGTANFILAVEHDPHPEGTTDGTQETMADLETRLQGEIDDLSDRIDDIEAGGSGLSQTEKNLILTLFSKAAYAESDAETAYDALETLWQVASYTITWSGDNYTKGNPSTVITEGSAFVSTVTANTGYELTNVTVTMGGVIVTGAWSGGQVTIPSVTGNIVITVSAVQALPSKTQQNCRMKQTISLIRGLTRYTVTHNTFMSLFFRSIRGLAQTMHYMAVEMQQARLGQRTETVFGEILPTKSLLDITALTVAIH